jgi:hypothetical protein
MTTEMASVKGQFSAPYYLTILSPALILTPISILKKLLSLPKEIRHMIYSELLWDKEVWRANNRIDGCLNLARHPRQDRSSLFMDTTGFLVYSGTPEKKETWSEVRHEQFKTRTGLITTVQRKDYVHLTHLIKALEKLRSDGKPDMRALVELLSWFLSDIVVDLGKDSQIRVSKGNWVCDTSLYNQISNKTCLLTCVRMCRTLS